MEPSMESETMNLSNLFEHSVFVFRCNRQASMAMGLSVVEAPNLWNRYG